MKKIRIRPAPGLKVRDPRTMRHICAGYMVGEGDIFWRRRIRAGDVTVMGEELPVEAAVKPLRKPAKDGAQ